MSENAGENLSASIERLIGKMERLYQRQAAESGTENILALLDRLSAVLSRMEDGRNFEAEINRKIDQLNHSMGRSMDFQESLVRGQGGAGKTFDRVINGTRLVGLILSALANSVQLMVENINQALDKKPGEASAASTARTQSDLSSILLPVSTLVKGLVEEKLRQQEEKAREAAETEPGESQKGPRAE